MPRNSVTWSGRVIMSTMQGPTPAVPAGDRIVHGGSGADLIVASPTVTFDWVPAAGDSYMSRSSYWDSWDTGDFIEIHVVGPSTAHGTVTFATANPAQAFAMDPVAFQFTGTGRLHADLHYPVDEWELGWTWDPGSGVLAPNFVSYFHNGWYWYGPDQVDFSATGIDEHYAENERGSWVLRDMPDLTALGGAGDDLIQGGTGNDLLFGEAGNDTVRGGLGDAFLSGGTGDDRLVGGIGSQLLDGGAGNDDLQAGRGTQTLDGGRGADTLRDGAGDTVLTGGQGADTFVFTGGGGTDIVTDLDPARDRIITGTGGGAEILGQAMEIGGSTLLDLGGGHTVLLAGVSLDQLAAHADELFAFA